MDIASDKQICVLCGIREATTLDHVPPRSIFPKPRPNDLVKVPACLQCNNSGSKYDEEFRVFLSLQLGMETPTTQRLWTNEALRTIYHNQRLRDHITQKSWEVDLRTPEGISLGKRRAVPMAVRPHNAVLDRIVRGLYFHHYGEILGPRISCKVTPLTGLPNEIASIINMMKLSTIGKDAVVYRHGRAAESPIDSLWFLLFYRKYLVMVETRSKARSNKVLQDDRSPASLRSASRGT